MPNLSDSRKQKLIFVAGFLYTLSLHKYVSRDSLSPGSGIQGYLEATLISAAFVCSFIATLGVRRQYAPSLALRCFMIFGILAIASSFRSFNPTLSVGEGVLFLVVLGIGYMICQAGLANQLFQSIYWTYTASLIFGLILGVTLPSQFFLWNNDEFTGRTRLSVFGTFPGTMGETAAYLVLLAPILFRRSHWISRLFLILMNFAAGGKTSTAVLLLLLGIEYLYRIQAKRFVVLTGFLGALLLLGLYFTVSSRVDISQMLGNGLSATYGHDVENEAVSLDGRLDLWRGSIRLLIDSPVLGYGFGGVREILTSIAAWSGSSHNGFLELGLAGGLLGLGIFLIALASVFRACMHSAPDLRQHTILVFIYMIMIALTGITFNFPSYFGIFILILLLYRSIQSSAQRVSLPVHSIRNLSAVTQ